ncbi:MAG: hypothetical protein COA96_01960 [SAR86 cluster bacterium]|uniref:Uncharacterized protein n=1 Tax=SAR86 cluster bacterium TaxID=2030880 RepID=A0A2A5B9F0_9GAMM|nr:MAG: hypothetical protein COA96_01960 [SAR86 cluster bacterium]
MIFSFLKLRKKTTAIVSGIAIALGSLWGVSIWQDVTAEEMLTVLLGTMLMLGGIMLAAILLIVVITLLRKALQKIMNSKSS